MRLGLLGSFAIVGAGIPVAVGVGISAMERGQGQVSVTFFGDGATNIGAFHEPMNLAAVWRLPVIFVCENNFYGEYSPIATTTPVQDLAVRATAYAMPSFIVNGNDVGEVYLTASKAVARARQGGGPALIECKTYRQCGHSRSDPAKYRPSGELESSLSRDPIALFRARVLEEGLVTEIRLKELEPESKQEVAAAAQRAAAAPLPTVRDLSEATYAQPQIA